VFGGTDGYTAGNFSTLGKVALTAIGSDLTIWRIGAKQDWNDKWSTFEYVGNYTFDGYDNGKDADVVHWAVGVIYRYNPSVQFGLLYGAFDADKALEGIVNDPSVIRFRTSITF
jgi:hypothetical protein